jgi:hypothetical protein
MSTPSENLRGLGVTAEILVSTFCLMPLIGWMAETDRVGSCERERPYLS